MHTFLPRSWRVTFNYCRVVLPEPVPQCRSPFEPQLRARCYHCCRPFAFRRSLHQSGAAVHPRHLHQCRVMNRTHFQLRTLCILLRLCCVHGLCLVVYQSLRRTLPPTLIAEYHLILTKEFHKLPRFLILSSPSMTSNFPTSTSSLPLFHQLRRWMLVPKVPWITSLFYVTVRRHNPRRLNLIEFDLVWKKMWKCGPRMLYWNTLRIMTSELMLCCNTWRIILHWGRNLFLVLLHQSFSVMVVIIFDTILKLISFLGGRNLGSCPANTLCLLQLVQSFSYSVIIAIQFYFIWLLLPRHFSRTTGRRSFGLFCIFLGYTSFHTAYFCSRT